MDTQQIIIQALAGVSSTKPMTESELHKLTGYSDIFQEACEQLYQARIINRCLQTKAGLTQYLYWPTANINNKTPAFIISHKRHLDATLTPSPKRHELAINQTDNSKDIDMSKSTNNPKYTSTLIVKTALANPGIKFNDLVDLLIGETKEDFKQARDMLYYCISAKLLSKDDQKRITIGNNDAWLIKNGFLENDGFPAAKHATPINQDKANSKTHITVTVDAGEAIKAIENNLAESNAEAAYIPKNDVFISIGSLHIKNLFGLLTNNSTLQLRITEDGQQLIHLKTTCIDTSLKLCDVDACFEAMHTIKRLQAA